MKAPRFWYRAPGATAALLAPLGAAYDLAGAVRRRVARPWRAPVPVICVGNLVAGGTGKTPVAISLARRLAAAGATPHLLSRGYGGTLAGPVAVDLARHDADAVGDEAMLLAAHAPAWVARDRAAGARAAVAAGATQIVMDDGFQNPSLAKDLSLLVVDGETGLGNGRVIPAGPLRERPARGLARADALVVMGGAARLGRDAVPVLHARLEPEPAAELLRGQAVVAFAGIGRPAKFFRTLERLGARIVARAAFGDHHRYDSDELMQLIELADGANAQLVTTAKDYARLPDAVRSVVQVVAVRVVWADEAALDRLLAPVLGPVLGHGA